MSAHVRRTLVLVVVLVLVVGLDVLVHRRAAPERVADLPSIAAVEPGTAAVLRLDQGDTSVVLERTGPEEWTITAPIEYPADRVLVASTLRVLKEGVPMDVRVDTGNHDRYGLESPDAIRVRIEDADERLLADFYVGFNAASGASSFVRFPDSDAVYRARLGGRHRYERAPVAWREHMILGFEPDVIEGIAVELPGRRYHMVRESGLDERGRPEMGPWGLAERPDFDLDQAAADGLARSIATLRAGEILSPDHPAGLDEPVATVVLSLITGDTRVLAFGRTDDGTFVQRDDRPEVYRVTDTLLDRLTDPLHTWRNRQLMSFPRAQVYRMALVEPGLTSILEQDPADSSWRMVQPANVDADLRQSMYNARELGDLRAEEIADVRPEEAGFPGDVRIEVTLLDGSRQVVEVGDHVPGRAGQRSARYVRTPDQPDRVGILSTRTLLALRKAWSR